MQVSNDLHARFVYCPQRREPLVHNDTPGHPHPLHTPVHRVPVTGRNRLPTVLVTEPPGKPAGRPQGEGVRTAVRPGGFGSSRAAGAAPPHPLFLPRRQARLTSLIRPLPTPTLAAGEF